jgi:two-component system response regulator FixJ
MTATAPTVFVVDDNPAVRRSLRALVGAAGLDIETYESGDAFLAAYDPRRAGCLVLDLRLRGEDGLDVLDELRRRTASLPIIVLTAHGSVPSSVRALKGGAIDFLEKPAPPAALLACIRQALELGQRRRDTEIERESVERRAARLTPRERQVAGLLLAGKRSKEIAAALGVTVRTVEGYRGRILEKMEVSSASALVATLLRTNVVPRT